MLTTDVQKYKKQTVKNTGYLREHEVQRDK